MFRRKRGTTPKKSSVEDVVQRTSLQSGLNRKQAAKSSLRDDLTDISKQHLSHIKYNKDLQFKCFY